MKRLFVIWASILVPIVSFSQFKDSVQIEEIRVVASKVEYMVGAKSQNLKSITMRQLGHSSLAEAITRHTPIYIKQNAGGLSTVFFRGTGSDHTAIMFGDINLNSLTLGHSNLSDIPIFLFDKVDVQYGSASSLYGTDAIGGVIRLSTTPKWEDKTRIFLQQDMGSFGSYFSGVKIAVGNKKMEWDLRAYRNQIANNFMVCNAFSSKNEEAKQKNAAILNWGVMGQFFYKLSSNNTLSTKVWHDKNWHEVQLNISENFYGGSSSQIENQNTRAVISFLHNSNRERLEANINYVRDWQLYDKDETQIISTNRIEPKVEYKRKKIWGGKLVLGAKYAFIQPDVYAYDDAFSEQRIDIYSSFQRLFFKKLELSVNIREVLVSNFPSEFVPSIGLNYVVAKFTNGFLHWKLSGTKGYKTPTFNDRVWRDVSGQLLGNPDLKPEKSLGAETGHRLQLQINDLFLQYSTTAFFNRIENLIEWIPIAGNSVPRNTSIAHIYGIEASLQSEYLLHGNSYLKFGGNYSFNQPIAKEKNGKKLNKKEYLIYAPIHSANMYAGYNYKQFSGSLDVSFTGERYINKDKTLDPFLTANLLLAAKFRLAKIKSEVSLGIQNLLDTEYQNWEAYAMPGRNYRISLKINY